MFRRTEARQLPVRRTGEEAEVPQMGHGALGPVGIVAPDLPHDALQTGPEDGLRPVPEQGRGQAGLVQTADHIDPSNRPRACFHASTRRQAVSMAVSSRVPFSTASMTLGIWVR